MLEPTLPKDEAKRQSDLEALDLLDTGPDPYMDALLRLAQRVFGIRTVLVTLLDNDRQWFKARRGTTLAHTPRSISFCAHSVHSDEIMEVPDALVDSRFADNPLVTGDLNVRFYAGIPLRAPSGSRVGSFCMLDDQPNNLSELQKQSMRDFALLLEGCLETHELRAKRNQLLLELDNAKRRALMDPLTQLLNREGLDQMLPTLLGRAQREFLCFGFIYGDLDHFKQVNDVFGHVVGDEVLMEVAQRIVAAIRPDDLAIRMGGEEFAILALVHSHDQLEAVAQRIVSSVARQPFDFASHSLKMTISLGTALERPEDVGDGVALIERADRALYKAKQGGRNRVVRS